MMRRTHLLRRTVAVPLPHPEAADRRPLRPDDFPDWTTYYWTYQYVLAAEYLRPCLEAWGVWRDGVRILDVGCGDAGASCALVEAGAVVDGLDLEPRRLTMARERAAARGLTLNLAVADITDPATLGGFAGPYDLVLFRDVLEHIPDLDAALEQSLARLAPGGAIVVIYPPYWSAYGGHQQTLHLSGGLPLARLPWVHWLGLRTWGALARSAGVDPAEWEDVVTVRRAALTTTGLQGRARRLGLEVRRARRYLLRPTYRLRYGTPVLGAGPLGRIPLLRDVLVTGSWELLARES